MPSAAATDDPSEAFRELVRARSTDVHAYAAAGRRLRRWMIDRDPHKPIYHFTGPESWINDPNGAIHHDGAYHLFYQFDPPFWTGAGEGAKRQRAWGHAVSTDLVHWIDRPTAIWPDSTHDRNGVYSGNIVIDDDGTPQAIYTGNVNGAAETHGLLATGDADLLTWRKQVVLHDRDRPHARSPVNWDAHLWRDEGVWMLLTGGATEGEPQHGAAYLWTSPDLQTWTLRHNIAPSIRMGQFWELPSLIQLDGRDVLFAGVAFDNPCWIGRYDRRAMIFTPDDPQPVNLDTGHYYAVNLNMTDDLGTGGTQRRIMHAWVTGPATPTQGVPSWQGAHAIPRVVSLRQVRLWQDPVAEIQRLRGVETSIAGDVRKLRDVRGDAMEIHVRFDVSRQTRVGVKLRVSDDGRDFTRVFYDADTGMFGVDGPTIDRNRLTMPRLKRVRQISHLPPGIPVEMRIFLDRSIVEVFVNGHACTARTFPPADALGVELCALDGAPRVEMFRCWRMMSAY